MIIRIAPEKKQQWYWTITLVFTILITLSSTIYSLSHGIYDGFPFIYFIPIILFVYLYPSRGVFFSLGISTVYILLVYVYSGFYSQAVAVSTAWFVVFVTIGVVTSTFAEGLREEELKYLGIFENSQAGIFTFDLDTQRLAEVNGKCAQMLRYERPELTGADLSRIMTGKESRERFVRQIREHRKTGDLELLFTARDGTTRQFLVSASVTPGNIAICSAIDITARKLAEQVIERARNDLEMRVNKRTEELMRVNKELTAEIEERKRFEAANPARQPQNQHPHRYHAARYPQPDNGSSDVPLAYPGISDRSGCHRLSRKGCRCHRHDPKTGTVHAGLPEYRGKRTPMAQCR